MNKLFFSILYFSLLSFATLGAQSEQERFKQLNDSRGKRANLIDYLKSEGKFRETEDGTLAGVDELSKKQTEILSAENNDRLVQFAIIAKLEGKSNAQVAKMFA